MVALNDPAAGNLAPGVTSPAGSPSAKGKKGKSKGGTPKGKSGTYRYTKSLMKAADPRGHSKAALTCLRCGQPGHFAVNCPLPSKSQGSSSPKSQGTKRAATDSVAMLENAHVTFQDQTAQSILT